MGKARDESFASRHYHLLRCHFHVVLKATSHRRRLANGIAIASFAAQMPSACDATDSVALACAVCVCARLDNQAPCLPDKLAKNGLVISPEYKHDLVMITAKVSLVWRSADMCQWAACFEVLRWCFSDQTRACALLSYSCHPPGHWRDSGGSVIVAFGIV